MPFVRVHNAHWGDVRLQTHPTTKRVEPRTVTLRGRKVTAVDQEFWSDWMKQHRDSPLLESGTLVVTGVTR
jgi:hypothetical protein